MKTKFLKSHTIRRMFERYDLRIHDSDIQFLVRMIQESDGKYIIDRVSNQRTVHLLPFRGNKIPVVYDKLRKTIITVLPPDARELEGL